MRGFEALMLLLVVGSAATLILGPPRAARWVAPLAAAALVVALPHLVLEGFRWAMVPAYLLAPVLVPLGARAETRAREADRGTGTEGPRRRSPLRWVGRATGLLLATLAVATVAALPPLFPVFELPAPTGSRAVGVTRLHLVDADRPETFTEDPTDVRELPIKVWYPAEPEGERAPYFDDARIRTAGLAGLTGLPPFAFRQMELVRGHARLDAPFAATGREHPVLLFSHGYGGAATQSTFLMEELASRGYVVFSLEHPYEALPLVLPGGRVAEPRLQTPEDPQALMDATLPLMERLVTEEATRDAHAEILRGLTEPLGLDSSFTIWLEDLQALADRLPDLNDADPRFAGRLDLGRIGVFGHSFGGALAAQFCARDPRCGAGINLDGAQFGDVVNTGVARPFMFMYGESSRWLNDVVHRRGSGPGYQLTIAGAAHLDFSDLPLASPLLGWASRAAPVAPVGTIGPRRMHAIVGTYVGAFFDRHLLGQPAPLLDGASGAYPEVRIERRR